MRILCAHTDSGIRPETRHALERHAPGCVDYRDVTDDPERAYGRIVAELWRAGTDFAVVEHDIVVRADVIEAFDECAELYCAFPYAWTTNVGPALGCTRFRGELLRGHPSAAAALPALPFRQVDYQLMRVELARVRGIRPHLHLPPVEHLNLSQQLLAPFDQLTLEEHLSALGWTIDPDGLTATYTGGAFG